MTAMQSSIRIVSLVPSLTETLCHFGLIDSLVGCTSFCVEPRELRSRVPSVGGTKDPRINEILALNPTHIVVNTEENTAAFIEQLNALKSMHSFDVIETFVEHPEDNFKLVSTLGNVFNFKEQAQLWIDQQTHSLQKLRKRAHEFRHFKFTYFIWMNPWMVAGNQTYISSTLALVGGINAIETSHDMLERYPTVHANDQRIAISDVLLFSSEPFPFKHRHMEEFQLQAKTNQPMLKVDGQALSWYGSRFEQTLLYLGRIHEEIQESLA
jgi:ABC-type Fe3+-hydroxamate transport system substrate-binding protein